MSVKKSSMCSIDFHTTSKIYSLRYFACNMSEHIIQFRRVFNILYLFVLTDTSTKSYEIKSLWEIKIFIKIEISDRRSHR